MKHALSLLLAGLMLASCGFTPMYAKNTATASNLGSAGDILSRMSIRAVSHEPEQKRLAQMLQIELEDLMNPSGGGAVNPLYHLNMELQMAEIPIAIARDGTISRYNIRVVAKMRMTRAADGALVYVSDARRTSSYNNETNAYYSTYVSRQDAIKQAILGLSEDIRLRLAAFFVKNPEPQAMALPQNQELPQ